MGTVHVAKSRRWLDQVLSLAPEFADKPIARIKRGDLLDLRAWLEGELTGKPNTTNKMVSTVKTVLSEAFFRGDIDADPGSRVGVLEYQQRRRGVMEILEVREILSKRPGEMATSPLVDLAIALLFCTGLRVGEVRALRWDAIDMDTGRCLIREAFKNEKEIGKPKWDKSRDIVLPLLLLRRLEAWHELHPPDDPRQFILSVGGGPPVGVTWLRNCFKRVLASAEASADIAFVAGDRWLTPHSCRHSLNSHLLAAETSPLLCQSFLGWSSVEVQTLTAVQKGYSHLQLLNLQDVADTIDRLYGPLKEQAAQA